MAKTKQTTPTVEKQTAKEKSVEELSEELLAGRELIDRRTKREVTVDGKTYTIRRIRKFARAKIDKLNREMYWSEQRAKQEITLREAKKISKKVNTLHAKTAAYYMLGLWAVIPFVHAILWRWLMTKTDEVICAINTVGSNDPQVAFFLTDCKTTSGQLALSMNLVGQSVKQAQKRIMSATNMLDEDASPKKEEDSKSPQPLKKARTMRK